MNAFGKTRQLTLNDFQSFERCYGNDAFGDSKRKDQGQDGRFRFYSRSQIMERRDNLDISWLKDTSRDPEDEMTEPEELALAIASHLRNALDEIDVLSEVLIGIEETA
jgi:type I restriction enzyme M protein